MIFHLLQRETKTIAGGAILIGALSLASRLVGLLRDRLFASTFGAGDTLDVYYAAFRIPDLILVIGASVVSCHGRPVSKLYPDLHEVLFGRIS